MDLISLLCTKPFIKLSLYWQCCKFAHQLELKLQAHELQGGRLPNLDKLERALLIFAKILHRRLLTSLDFPSIILYEQTHISTLENHGDDS